MGENEQVKPGARQLRVYRPNRETNVPGETPPNGTCGESEVETSRGLGAGPSFFLRSFPYL